MNRRIFLKRISGMLAAVPFIGYLTRAKAEPEKFDWRINVTCIEKPPVGYMPTDVERDKIIADALDNGWKEPFTHAYGANVIVSKPPRKCDCSRQQLMRDGCKCGGI